MKEVLTLLELQQTVRQYLKLDFPDTYWIQAEVSECKEHFSGHCYLELVQKKERSDALCAKSRATIWANTWFELKSDFEAVTGTRLQPGQKILAEVTVDFHELYGYSLVIRNLDPTYTLGDVNRRKQEVIRQLTDEGVIGLNKELEWPEVARRLAVISSPNAAGYEDFTNQLNTNEYGFTFKLDFYPATMQGEQAPMSIVEALNSIQASGNEYDVVVLIRGGGATTDLICFDDYELCYYCAQYPLPLLTGIGHERDTSVLDLVAHTSVKTPTAAAEYLISCLSSEAYRLDANAEKLSQRVGDLMEKYRQRLQNNSERLRRSASEGLHKAGLTLERNQDAVRNYANRNLLVNKQKLEMFVSRTQHLSKQLVHAQEHRAGMLENRLNHLLEGIFNGEKHRLELLQNQLDAFSPDVMIQRGFSLTLHNGKILKSVAELQPGDELETHLKDGIIESKIYKTNPHK